MSMVAAVTGATGAVGPALVHELFAAGYRVRVLTRRPAAAELFAEPVELVHGDIADAAAVRALVRGADVAFHLAARLHARRVHGGLADEYQRINVEGTRVLGNAAQAAGVRRVVFLSTIAVYGASRPGTILDESSPPAGDSLYARTKLIGEQLLLEMRNCGGEPLAVVLRSAAVYGPRMKGNLRLLVHGLARHGFVQLGDGSNRRTLVFDRDLASAAIMAVRDPAAAGEIFNVTDGTVHRLSDMVATICELLHRRAPSVRLPVGIARTAGRCTDAILRLSGQPPLVVPLIDKFVEDLAVSGLRLEETLRFRPAFDLRSGLRAALPAVLGTAATT